MGGHRWRERTTRVSATNNIGPVRFWRTLKLEVFVESKQWCHKLQKVIGCFHIWKDLCACEISNLTQVNCQIKEQLHTKKEGRGRTLLPLSARAGEDLTATENEEPQDLKADLFFKGNGNAFLRAWHEQRQNYGRFLLLFVSHLSLNCK